VTCASESSIDATSITGCKECVGRCEVPVECTLPYLLNP
jgi:hypothetical protein